MSDSNVGSRKGRNHRNNLYIVYAIINYVLNNPNAKSKAIDLQIYDIEKMFDKIRLKEAINDFWDSGVQDDNLVLLYKLNKNNKAIVKTPVGESDEIHLDENVLQGESFGPLLASNQLDTIGKESKNDGENLYMYQGVVPIRVLEMVDDTLGISECGVDSIVLNSYINTKVEMKNLKFGINNKKKASKCHHMHLSLIHI